MAGAGAGAGAGAPQVQVRFEDVMVRFSEEELGLLEKWQRDLYVEVLTDIYESLIIIGNPVTYSDFIAWWKQGEQQNCPGSQESRAVDSSANEGLGQMSSPGDTEALDPPTIVHCRAEEEGAPYGGPGGAQEDSHGLLMADGGPRRDVRMPQLEKASPAPSRDAAAAREPPECPRAPGGGQAEGRPHLCTGCGARFRHYPCFLLHQPSHEKAKVWLCAHCSTSFLFRSDLALHEESHFNEALGACSRCGESCLCTPSLRFHFAARPEKSAEETQEGELRRGGRPGQEKPYACSQCGEQFSLEGNLQRHYRYCCPERLQRGGENREPDRPAPKGKRSRPACPGPPAQWACSLCSANFPSRYGLFKHRRRHHAGERHQSATESDRSVSLRRRFGGRSPVGVTKTLHRCPDCGKRLPFKRQLVAHMKAHAEEGRCRCTYCGERLGSGEGPRIHREEQAPAEQQPESSRGAPGGKELRQCAVCGKSFKKSYFPDHQAWHAGVRFRCSLCGKKSNFYSSAYRHFLAHRKGGDFSTCSVCGAGIQSERCPCAIEKFRLTQKPPPHPREETGRPAAGTQDFSPKPA
ncbi:uncharacterized protein LOC143820754 [Paroedura picta]|uniref:uncharacterized protein LOC143820754 n=1 Tax=Paroedura picta TaxID=143630 RepID=UPI004057C31F